MEKNTAYYLFERAQHVFGEARRVHEFKALCDDKSIAEDEKIKQLGELMNASHKSCDMLYDCSSPELNELTTMATKAGALGSRLTGAGWGGCCVSLVKRSDLAEFVPKLMDYFTKERPMGD
jgi:N-acetylgalactosamine kinase